MHDRIRAIARHETLWLLCIVAVGAAVRTYIWFHGYALDGMPGLVRHGDGYLQIASTFRPGSDVGFFDHWRASYQFIYPLYLAPIFIFDLNDGVYVFWLHHAFAAATTSLIYVSARRMFGVACAILAACAYAMDLQFVYWFNWAYADMAFHFHLALFLFCAVVCWNVGPLRKAICLSACAFLVIFSRPDGLIVTAAFAASLFFHFLSDRIGTTKAFVAMIAVATCTVGAVTFAVSQNKQAREAVLSNVSAGWGLYYGSQRTPTRAEDVDRMLLEMRRYGIEKAAVDPENRNQWYWNSVAGLQRIGEHPWRYVGYSAERFVNAIVPSFFREGVSLRYKAIDRSMALFLLVGIGFALTAKHGMASLTRSLAVSAFALYLLVALYQAEWDVRVQLSAHVFLIPIASFGWIMAFRHARTRLSTPNTGVVITSHR